MFVSSHFARGGAERGRVMVFACVFHATAYLGGCGFVLLIGLLAWLAPKVSGIRPLSAIGEATTCRLAAIVAAVTPTKGYPMDGGRGGVI